MWIPFEQSNVGNSFVGKKVEVARLRWWLYLHVRKSRLIDNAEIAELSNVVIEANCAGNFIWLVPFRSPQIFWLLTRSPDNLTSSVIYFRVGHQTTIIHDILGDQPSNMKSDISKFLRLWGLEIFTKKNAYLGEHFTQRKSQTFPL